MIIVDCNQETKSIKNHKEELVERSSDCTHNHPDLLDNLLDVFYVNN
jgi:hypothetical protein